MTKAWPSLPSRAAPSDPQQGSGRDKTYKLEYDEENVVDDEWPLSAVSIAGNTKEDGSYRSEHEHQGDTPCNIRLCLVKRLGQTRHRQRNSEELLYHYLCE